MSKYDEQIIVVPRDILFEQESNAFNGFLTKNDPQGEAIFNTFSNYCNFICPFTFIIQDTKKRLRYFLNRLSL